MADVYDRVKVVTKDSVTTANEVIMIWKIEK